MKKKDGFVQTNKKNAVCWKTQQQKFQVELSEDQFCRAQSQMTTFHTVRKQLRVQTHSSSSSSASHRACPSPGPLVFQFQARPPRLRPAGICSAARFHPNIEQRARKTSVPFFMYDPRSPGTSSRGSRLFFYFEVEFLHLCLKIK